jgi:hypothetical protein
MSHAIQEKVSTVQDRSRAERRGSDRSPRSRRTRSALAVVAVVAAAVVVVVILTTEGGGAKPAAKYGGLPSWLPKTTARTDHLVTATAAHPKLAVEGDTVRVALAHGQADTTIVGPQVPEEGKFPVPATSRCSFTVTLTRVSGDVPLRAGDFTILAENSHLYHPLVSGPHGEPVPSVVKPGQTVMLTIEAVLPTGGGQVRWKPQSGPPISSWDFDVEID